MGRQRVTYFSIADMTFLEDLLPGDVHDESSLDSLRADLHTLHTALQAQLRTHNLDLHLSTTRKLGLLRSAADIDEGRTLSIPYTRSQVDAITVERLMGREEVASPSTIDARRHPVIELRLTAEHFAVELILSPDAWWDQENLAGKLTINRYQQEFNALMQHFESEYRLGFWRGVHLSDMHLTAAQFQHPVIMREWMSTFDPSNDWFRLGIWHEWDDEALTADDFAAHVLHYIRDLYPIYTFMRWSSDNNFRDFYLDD